MGNSGLTGQTQLALALDHYQRGDFNAAGALAQQLLPTFPLDPTVNGLLGMVAAQTGRHAEAVPFLRIALSAAPDNVPLRIGLGFALVNGGRLDEAKAVAAGSEVPQLQRIVAFADQQQGRHDAAIAGYRRVLSGFPQDAESWNNLGLVLTATGNIGEAVPAFRKALALRENPDFSLNLSRALAAGERHPERQRLLRDAAARTPDHVHLLVELGLAEAAMGDFTAAQSAYRRALGIAPRDPGVYLEYGMLLESLNRIDELELLVH